MTSLDARLLQKLAPALEASVNHAVALDPSNERHLKRLEGCVLEIQVSSLKQSLFLTVEQLQIKWLAQAATPTVKLSGSAIALIKLGLLKDKNALFKRKEVSLSGDAVRAQQIQSFMRELNIDWEALLAEALGDIPARLLSTNLSTSLNWTRELGKSFWQDLEEYIKYELQVLPNKAAAQQQFASIDQVRLASERLAQRASLLRAQLSPAQPPTAPERKAESSEQPTPIKD